MKYFNELRDDSNNYTYSVDGCRINFSVSERFVSDISSLIMSLRSDITVYPTSTKSFNFRNLIKFDYDTESSMTMGYGFNGTNAREDMRKGYLDFNPNKVGSFSQFWADYREIKSLCEDFVIDRIDIALDIPVKREYLILEKDNRKYELNMRSISNRTEYLGQRSHVGFVKLYNKTLESSLDYDLTRLEITCEPNLISFISHFPKVYDISLNNQLSIDFESLNDTDKYILGAEWELLNANLDPGLTRFNSLSYYQKKKLKPFLMPESSLVLFSRDSLTELFRDFMGIF